MFVSAAPAAPTFPKLIPERVTPANVDWACAVTDPGVCPEPAPPPDPPLLPPPEDPAPPPTAISPDVDAIVGLKYEPCPDVPDALLEAEPPAPTAIAIVDAEEIVYESACTNPPAPPPPPCLEPPPPPPPTTKTSAPVTKDGRLHENTACEFAKPVFLKATKQKPPLSNTVTSPVPVNVKVCWHAPVPAVAALAVEGTINVTVLIRRENANNLLKPIRLIAFPLS